LDNSAKPAEGAIMSAYTLSDADATPERLDASSDKLVRASMAAGFAMVEELAHEPAREARPGPVRRTWHKLEHYLSHILAGSRLRPSDLSA
jgi:hypothetical protein